MKTKQVSLYLVDGPFQLINAIEAKDNFKSEGENIVVIRILKGKTNLTQIKSCLQLSEWDKIIFVNPFLYNFTTFIKILLLTFKFKNLNVDRIFIGGFYYPDFHILANNLNPSEIFIIDDGMASLDIINKIERGFRFYELIENNNLKQVRQIFYKFLGLTIPEILDYKIFTFIEMNKITNSLIIQNDFKYIRKLITDIKISIGITYFIGSPLVELGVISEQNFQKYMNFVVDYFHKKHNSKIVYIPHRRESERQIKFIQKLGIEVLRINKPIELFLILGNELPKCICSFYSTALITIDKIFVDIEIYSFKIPTDAIAQLGREGVNRVYDFYSQSINIVKLNNV